MYYLPEVVKTQAKRQEENLGEDWQNLFQEAQEKALESIRRPGVTENLAATNADKILRRSALASLPDKNALKDSNREIPLTLQSPYSEELRVLKAAVERNDIATIVKEFSIRDSGLPTAVARALRYGNKEDYQRAVTVTVQRDEAIAHALRELIEENSSA